MPILQLCDSKHGWIDAGEIEFKDANRVKIEYDIDYASEHFGEKASRAFSINFPVNIEVYEGKFPGFLIDLLPQGAVLDKLLQRYKFRRDDIQSILTNIPLASPGNLRIKEPWAEIERTRGTYIHKGFTKDEIIDKNIDFIDYMEEWGVPIGGASGAAGGAPKFLLREDKQGRFHAEGYLEDSYTVTAWLIKLPFNSSDSSKLILETEYRYFDLLRYLGLNTKFEMQWSPDILFVPRFDRVRENDNLLHYYGLESFYSCHNLNTHGERLSHESNVELIHSISDQAENDIIEYWFRDITNRCLGNSDNHGRNTSLIKQDNSIYLAPIYDVTAMKFWADDWIVPQTRWTMTNQNIAQQYQWLTENYLTDIINFKIKMNSFRSKILDIASQMAQRNVPQSIIEKTKPDFNQVFDELREIQE